MRKRNRKKTFALLTVPTDEKQLKILTFNDAEIILDNKYSGKDFMENASNYLMNLKNTKNLEGVILDFYCHQDPNFLFKIRKYFCEFCETKVILFRLVYQNIIFTSMLLYHSEMNFNFEDTVYAIWIKNDMLFSYKLEKRTLYFINEIKIEDDFVSNKEYGRLLDSENPPKFLVLGSRSFDSRLKELKNRFKAAKTKVMQCTYEDCLKKSASHYLSRFIRAKDWKWNFKLSNSTVPEMDGHHGFRRKKNSNTEILFGTLIAFIGLAILLAFFLSNSPTQLSGGRSYFNEITKISRNDKEIYGYIAGEEDTVRLSIYGAQTKRGIGILTQRKQNFVADFLSIFKHPKFKAIIFQINSLSQRSEFYQKVSYLDIPYLFVKDEIFMYLSILMASEVNVKIGEYILMIFVNDEGYKKAELQYTQIGYRQIEKSEDPEYFSLEESHPELIRHKILGSNKPSKIILHANYGGIKLMKFLKDTVLKEDSEIVISLEENFRNYEMKFVFEKVKWMFDKRYTRFYISPTAHRKYMIGFKCGKKEYPLNVYESDEALPFKAKLLIKKSPLQHFIGSTNLKNDDFVIHSFIKFSKDAHANQFSLENEADYFFITSKIIEAYLALPSYAITFQFFLPSKIPIIAFYGDLSFIFIYDKNCGYKMLDSWNGEYGRDLYISFDEEQPKFFEKASKILTLTCSSVVHDMIKVLSYSPDDIPLTNLTFGYNITKDSDNQIWFITNTFNGIEKKSPNLLMSMLLKKHIEAISNGTNENPKEIALYLFEEFDEPSENRIKNGLKESCKLAEIECSFIETLPLELV